MRHARQALLALPPSPRFRHAAENGPRWRANPTPVSSQPLLLDLHDSQLNSRSTSDELSCRKVKEADAAVVGDAGQPAAVGAEAHAPHLVGVLAAGLQIGKGGREEGVGAAPAGWTHTGMGQVPGEEAAQREPTAAPPRLATGGKLPSAACCPATSSRVSSAPRTCAHVRVARSHSFTLPSLLPVANALPPGCADTLSTHDSWPAHGGARQERAMPVGRRRMHAACSVLHAESAR